MRARAAAERHYRWEWRLEASPEALWPLVADTNRFNRDAGVPAVERSEAGPNARRRLSMSRLGVGIEWVEEPFEWVEPRRFSVVRRYARGPVAEMRVAVQLRPLDGGGTLLVYEVDARPRALVGRAAIAAQIGLLGRRRFERTFRVYDREALAAGPPQSMRGPSRPPPGGDRRLAAAAASLVSQGLAPELVQRLASLVEHGDELTVARMRPYALADVWQAPRRAVLELFLHATRAGLLEFRWDLLCPLCRSSAETSATLDAVSSGVHCDTCLIDFNVDFDRSVELAFRPSPSVREVEAIEFCVGGPRLTPHVVVQQLLPVGGSRTISTALQRGGYRLRVLDGRAYASVVVGPGRGEATLRLDESGWAPREAAVGESPSFRIENASADEQLVVLERTGWQDDVVTAAEVTTLQLFRDLFSAEALRPGEPISVGSLTVVFTDLRDSTRYYREIGDAPAFGSVLEHLDVLRAAVDTHGGAVVKAMGDAIMAVFTSPASALASMFEAQGSVAQPLRLKVGVHAGPCIAVTQNGRLDYFGSTVNLAARLVGLSTGNDIVASKAVLEDPEVADQALQAEPLQATLKGFEDERFELFRLAAPAHVEAARAAG